MRRFLVAARPADADPPGEPMTDITPDDPSLARHRAEPPPLQPDAVPRRLWLIALVTGVVLWIAGAASTAITEDTILVPNIIILGTFLVPVCTILFVLGRPREAHLTAETLVLGFLAGGTAGVVLTAVTEVELLPDAAASNLGVGLVEEGGKALILVAVATVVRLRVPRDGMVLGATVGAGFAAFESAGYALRALIQNSDDHPVLNILETEVFRAVLAPFGHITWSALLGGAIFASAWATGRFRLDRRVVWTFLGVAALHGLWDGSYGAAIRISEGLGGQGWVLGWPNTAAWVGTPTGADLVRFQAIYDVLLAINAIAGVAWAMRRWRAYQVDRWRAAHPAPAATAGRAGTQRAT
jgi:RsiW-degrading membrane proteinase PrsW (M82 family)